MEFNICTWNISFGQKLDLIKKAISLEKDFKDIDIFAFQEASIHENIPDAKQIAKELGKDFDYFQIKAQISKGFEQANAFVWNKKKINITKTSTILLPNYSNADLKRGEHSLKRFLPKESRNCIVISGTKKNISFRIYNTHLEMIGFDLRRKQLLSIINHDSKENPVDLVLITGDFNTFRIFKYPKWERLNADAKKYEFTDVTTNINWTFHRKLIRYRQKLDIIFLKNSEKIKNKTYIKRYPGSDHFPIFAKLLIDKNNK